MPKLRASTPSAREQFCAVLASGPLLQSDAIILLAGEDAEARAKTAAELFRQGAAPVIVVTGGVNNPPRQVHAESVAAMLLGLGVAPDRILLEPTAQHTREQAVATAAMAKAAPWKRIILVASPYHMPRAFLTFLRALEESELTETVRIVPCPTSHVAWFEAPPGVGMVRLGLLADEFAKCEDYATKGHVATWRNGLAYLEHWEWR